MNQRQEWILDAVTEVLRESFSNDDLRVSLETDIILELGADSADFLDIICRLDFKFNIPQPDEKSEKRQAIRQFTTVQQICEYAEGQLAQQKAELIPAA